MMNIPAKSGKAAGYLVDTGGIAVRTVKFLEKHMELIRDGIVLVVLNISHKDRL